MKNKKFYIAIILALLFTINTVLVLCDYTVPFDDAIHNLITHLYCPALDVIMRIITFFASDIVIVSIVVLSMLYLFVENKKIKSLFVGLTISASMLTYLLFNMMIKRARPIYISILETRYSYPSGHTTASITIYGLFLYIINKGNYSKKTKKILSSICLFFMVFIPISRLYLGAHFISDVIGGILLASLYITLSTNIYEELTEK